MCKNILQAFSSCGFYDINIWSHYCLVVIVIIHEIKTVLGFWQWMTRVELGESVWNRSFLLCEETTGLKFWRKACLWLAVVKRSLIYGFCILSEFTESQEWCNRFWDEHTYRQTQRQTHRSLAARWRWPRRSGWRVAGSWGRRSSMKLISNWLLWWNSPLSGPITLSLEGRMMSGKWQRV